MDARRRPHRIALVRLGRRYSACGLRGYRARGRHATRRERNDARRWFDDRAGLLPGATLALIVLFSAFVLGYPPVAPDNPQARAPIAGFAHYTFADYADASR